MSAKTNHSNLVFFIRYALFSVKYCMVMHLADVLCLLLFMIIHIVKVNVNYFYSLQGNDFYILAELLRIFHAEISYFPSKKLVSK